MSKECISYNDITKNSVCMSEEKIHSLNARFDTKPQDTKVMIWGYELCNGADWKDFLDVVNKLGKEKTDLEAKLSESEKKNFELIAKLNLKEHRPAFCTLADRECEALGQVEELKQQLSLYEQSNKVLNDQLNKSTEHIGELEDYYTGYTEALVTENLELKEQLSEKEKEIAYMTKQAKKFNNEAQKYFEDAYCNDTIYQDKISFALEELEKAKETTECVLDNALKNSSLNQSYYDRLLDEIDNQIKLLKGGK